MKTIARSIRLASVTLALLALAAPAFAAGPLAICTTGQPYRWGGGGANIPFNPDLGTLGPLTNAQAVTLVADSFDQWGDIPTAATTYLQGAFLPADVTTANFGPYFSPVAPDGLSAIVFDANGTIFNLLFGPGSGVLGFAGPEWGIPATCTITEGVAFLNGGAFGVPQEAFDVIVHEFGHYQNLAHTVVNGQIFLGDSTGPTPNNTFPIPPLAGTVETMYPFYFGVTSGTSSLHADDVASLSALYPEPSFATTTGSISGYVFAPNGTTPLTGVNVIARNVANPFTDAVSAISSDYTDVFTPGSSPFVGLYTIRGLTPGAQYVVFVDEILAGGFSTPPLPTLPGPEEFYNGANESNDPSTDDPAVSTPVTVAANSTASGVDVIFNTPGEGDPLPVGDDGSVQVFLPFTFEICGLGFESVFVNANGNLTFGAPSSDFSESIAEFLAGPPRIAGAWDDLNPGAAGVVFFETTSNTLTVTWQNVPEFVNTGSNTFSITLKQSADHIDIDYGSLTLSDALAGVSCGGAIASGFETATDLSALTGRTNLHNQPAVFQLFTAASPLDLDDTTLEFTGTTTYDDQWAGPNDSFSHARSISLPFDSKSVNDFTEIEPAGADVDYFRFDATGGQTLIAEILTGQLDTVVGLFDASGTLVAFDDDSGPGLLSRLVFGIPADGEYTLAVSTFPDTDFTGDGVGGGRYVLNLFTVVGTPLILGDDATLSVPIGFTFPYQGGSFTSVFVNSNGNLTFGAGSTDLSESVTDLLNGPRRIAAVWDDLNPAAGGLVLVNSSASSFTVTFLGVPEFATTNSNTFSITLTPAGSVTIAYGDVAALDGLAGVSQGGGAANPGETNLSAGSTFPVTGTTYELFTGVADPFDLDNTTKVFQ
jgi:hypothetical protein